MRPKIPPKKLRDIFAQIPAIDCQGKCENSCGPIGCSSLERRLIEERSGHRLEANGEPPTCAMLKLGRCSVYSIRPVLCRLWGVVESMPCPHGCKPERVLPDVEGYSLMAAAARLAGDSDADALDAMLATVPPSFWKALKDHAAGAPDLGGTVVTNRAPAAQRLYEEARRVRDIGS